MEHKLHMNNQVGDTDSGEPLFFRGIDNFFIYLFIQKCLYFSIST